jgi:hypothetical protein
MPIKNADGRNNSVISEKLPATSIKIQQMTDTFPMAATANAPCELDRFFVGCYRLALIFRPAFWQPALFGFSIEVYKLFGKRQDII